MVQEYRLKGGPSAFLKLNQHSWTKEEIFSWFEPIETPWIEDPELVERTRKESKKIEKLKVYEHDYNEFGKYPYYRDFEVGEKVNELIDQLNSLLEKGNK